MSKVALGSSTPSETRRIGARLGRLLQAGDVVLLKGELGAGKTLLTQGIGQGMKVVEPVKSPSFVLVNEYHGRITLHHADLFRLNGPSEVADLALEEQAADGVLVVEWPERAWAELPTEHLLVRIEEEAARSRRIAFEAHGVRYETLLRTFEAAHA